MNLSTPKELFAKGPHAKKWVDLTASDMWTDAVHTALAQMTIATTGGDPAFASRVQGAKDFAVIMSNLGERAPMKQPDPKKNLNHNV